MNQVKNTLKILLLGTTTFFFQACEKEVTTKTTEKNNFNRIMPLGASRVEGNRPNYESYRYELWKDLNENEWTFDFVGTMNDKGTYPSVNGESFDKDHEGRGGWTSGEILNKLNTWLNETDTPDIVLFSSPGGNDALQDLPYMEAITNINGIIDALQSYNPKVTILIEQMAPGHTNLMSQKLKDYFENLQQDMLTVAATQTNSSSKVIAVDMFTGFTDAMLADPVHYNESGADFIATNYYKALVSVMVK